jgi:hypothetical protein
MEIERDKYLPYLERYLNYCNIEIRPDGQIRCPNKSAHRNGDKNFSAKLYRNESTGHSRVQCFACGLDGDIYDMVGHIKGENDFVKQYQFIDECFGNGNFIDEPKKETPLKNAKDKIDPVALPFEQAKLIYTDENINRIRSFSHDELNKNGVIKGRWEYCDIDGNIIAADIRIEQKESPTPGEKPLKNVISFWYNGKSLKMSGGPLVIYNLYNSVIGEGKDKPILIHEGAKCASIGNKSFNKIESISYNRGSQNAEKHDWSKYYKDRIVYILPDNDGPGLQAAQKIKSKLPQAIILKTIHKHFETDDIKGADIEQILEQDTIENIENFILNYSDEKEKEIIGLSGPKCLGVSDNGMLFFIDRSQRLFNVRRNRVQKDNLMVLADLDYWQLRYMNDKGTSILWDEASNDILTQSFSREFDDSKIRGRGAWREENNFIYHDGKNTTGKTSGEYMYLRKNKRDIGINDTPINVDILLKLRELSNEISFQNASDLIKLLGWSLISPFCGALRFRPGLLLTGESGSGKTTVLEKIVKPLSAGKHYNTHHSSPAGVRADVLNDSCAILLEEAEANQNTDEKDKNTTRNNFFSMMRASSSDDSPEGVKSNAEQQVVKYSMKNMFLFVSITPTIAEIADDNRIFKVNFTKNKQSDGDENKRKWENIEGELIELLNRENCRKIRSYVWKIFPKIINDTKIIIDVMKYEFKKTSRIADGESILISAYLNVFKNIEMTRENIKAFLTKYYLTVGVEEERNETDELIKKIFDEIIEIAIERDRKKISIKECLDCLKNKDYETFLPNLSFFDSMEKRNFEIKRLSELAEKEIRRILGHYGIAFQRDGMLALSNNSDKLKRILNREDGYAKIFHRHKNFKETKNAFINGQSPRCVIIDIYKDEKKIDQDSENLPF